MSKEFKNSKIKKLYPKGVIDESSKIEELEIDAFFLSLALIFNDIKGLVLIEKDINSSYRKPDKLEESDHSGELGGIKLQMFKYFVGTLQEFINLISKKKELIQSDAFEKYYNQLNKYDKNIWLLLLNIIGVKSSVNYNKDNIKLFNKILRLVRNKVSFHYDADGDFLVKGFRRHFYKDLDKPGKGSAMYSAKKQDFYGTRYYYADAALDGFFLNEADKLPKEYKLVKEVYVTGISVAKVVAGLLEVYHTYKRKN